MIILLFFIAFVILIYLFITNRQTVIVYEEPSPVTWWPWDITSYNWWPYWNGSYGGSYGGVYGSRIHHNVPHHESRPWGGASRHANASAPSRGGPGGHGGGGGGHGGGHR